jgi:hypothetical protein
MLLKTSLAAILLLTGFALVTAQADGQGISACSRDYYQEQAKLNEDHVTALGSRDSRGQTYYLFPYNLHLTPNSTSNDPIVVKDAGGNTLSGNIFFFGFDRSMLSINDEGYVTSLRAETGSEIGTWVHASFNGHTVANACIVRVLSQDYNLSFTQIVGEKTALYFPTTVSSVDVDYYVHRFQVPLVNEYAYRIQSRLMGLVPFDSARQIMEVDVAESEESRVCGVSGNPIRLGWNIKGDNWQNCFLVPYLPPRSPQWFVMYHELGHNFTWPSYTFGRGLGPSVLYSEGLAAALSLETMRSVLENPTGFPVELQTTQSLQHVHNLNANNFRNKFSEWYTFGADFSKIDPDVINGLLLRYRDIQGYSFERRFFMPLRPKYYPETSPIIDYIDTHGLPAMHTFFAALVSAAFEADLSDVFAHELHFPLDQPFFQFSYPILRSILDAGDYLCGDANGDDFVDVDDVIFIVNYIFLGGPEPTPYESADANCVGEVDIDDLLYLINYIFSGGSAPCSNCL